MHDTIIQWINECVLLLFVLLFLNKAGKEVEMLNVQSTQLGHLQKVKNCWS